MSGHFSRRKGLRNEYLVRDELRALGYKADRVPSSGAAEGFKGDIKFTANGRDFLAEVKSRANYFGTIYDFYNHHGASGVLGVSIPSDVGLLCVSIGASLNHVLDNSTIYPPSSQFNTKEDRKALRKLITIYPLLQSCDFLVIRDDRKPFLYIRYR